MLKDIKAVIFDMDGTLIDSLWIWKQVDVDYLKKHNIEVPDDLQKCIAGLSFTETAVYFKNRFNIEDDVESIKLEWQEMVGEYYRTVIKIKNGVREFLEYLKNNNFKIGMATSSFRSLVDDVLKSNGIYYYFDEIVTTCEVPRDKSFPDVFLETARRLGVDPEQCLVFEDTYTAVLGARAAGMKVIGVYDEHGTCTPAELAEAADHLIEDFICIVNDYCK